MDYSEWIEKLRKHLAIASVGNSTLMMQAGENRVSTAQTYLKNSVPLDRLSQMNEGQFQKFLDTKTNALKKKLIRPDNGQPNWGAARKVINIFLRLCVMNKDLHKYYKLSKIEDFLEVPLDNHIVKALDARIHADYGRDFKIKTLSAKKNKIIQKEAYLYAVDEGVYRYELDILFWNEKKTNN